MAFTAPTNPTVVGLYISKFIETPNTLSFPTIITKGSGYTSRPTITVDNTNGANGSGAILEPIMSPNGTEVWGLNFVFVRDYRSTSTYSKTDPDTGIPDYVCYNSKIYKYINATATSGNQPDISPLYWQYVRNGSAGTQKGSGYSNNIAPNIIFTGGGASVQATASVSLSNNTTILGKTANENALLQFIYDNGINHIALYDLRAMNWGSTTSTNTSAPGTNLLASFISRARTSGVTSVAAVRSGSAADTNFIVNYNSQRTLANERFDWINIEKEWWNGDGTFAQYLSNLQTVHNTVTGATHPMKVEIYIGWPSSSEMAQLLPYLERVLVHDYRLYPDYNYTKTRLKYIGDGAQAINKVIDVMPIFSAERVYSPWGADYEFMGAYYTGNTIYNGYYEWAVPTNSTPHGSYNFDSYSNTKNYCKPVGHIIFTQKLLNASQTAGNITPISCSAVITASGSTTFITGNTVTLQASNGASWLWNNGATTQNISVNSGGTYSVTIDNGLGCVATSNSINITVLPIGSYTVTIIPDGPTFFSPGGSVELTTSASTTGITYTWFPFGQTGSTITATTSGTYYVIGDDGLGNTFTSSTVTVNANYNPGGGGPGGTEEPTEAIINSVISYSNTETIFPWISFNMINVDLSADKFYVFVKTASSDGEKTGLRFSIDGGENFIPLEEKTNTTLSWHRYGAFEFPIWQKVTEQYFTVSFQATNNKLILSQFVISKDPEFIPGPY